MNFQPLSLGDYDFSSDPLRASLMGKAAEQAPPAQTSGETYDAAPGNPWSPKVTTAFDADSADLQPADDEDGATAADAAQSLYGPDTLHANPSLGAADPNRSGAAANNDGIDDAALQKVYALLSLLVQGRAATPPAAPQAQNPAPPVARTAAPVASPPAAATKPATRNKTVDAGKRADAAGDDAKTATQGGAKTQTAAKAQSAAKPQSAARPQAATQASQGAATRRTQGGGMPGGSSAPRQSVSAGALVPVIPGMGIAGTAVAWGDPATAAALNDERGNGWTKGTLSY